MTAATPSMTDLARSVSGSLRKPASREPTTAMAPTEKSSVALTKPSAKPLRRGGKARLRPLAETVEAVFDAQKFAEERAHHRRDDDDEYGAVSMAPETPMTSTHSAST